MCNCHFNMKTVEEAVSKRCELKNKLLPNLKNGGRVTRAQKTTMARCQVNVEQQLRFHATVDHAALELKRLNKPSKENTGFLTVILFVQWNLKKYHFVF